MNIFVLLFFKKMVKVIKYFYVVNINLVFYWFSQNMGIKDNDLYYEKDLNISKNIDLLLSIFVGFKMIYYDCYLINNVIRKLLFSLMFF